MTQPDPEIARQYVEQKTICVDFLLTSLTGDGSRTGYYSFTRNLDEESKSAVIVFAGTSEQVTALIAAADAINKSRPYIYSPAGNHEG